MRDAAEETDSCIFEKINGKYVRQPECALREENMHVRLDAIVEAIRNMNAAGD